MLSYITNSIILNFSHQNFKEEHFFIFREKPHDSEWLELRDQKVPLLLNFSQCKLNLNQFYPVIEHCSEVLEFQPGELISGFFPIMLMMMNFENKVETILKALMH